MHSKTMLGAALCLAFVVACEAPTSDEPSASLDAAASRGVATIEQPVIEGGSVGNVDITITNSGACALTYDATARSVDGAPWLRLDGAGGMNVESLGGIAPPATLLVPGASTFSVRFNVASAMLRAGTYTGNVTITGRCVNNMRPAAGSPAVIPVNLSVVTVTVVGMTLYAGDFSGGGGGGALDGTGTAARFDFPEGLAADIAGNLYVAQGNGRRVSKIAPGAVVTTVLHQPIGTATNNFGAVALAPDASLYTAGISFCGLFRTAPPLAAGATTLELPVTSGCGTETRGIAVDANGVVHLSLTSNNSIVRIGTVDGSGNYPASVLAGAASQFVPPGSADGTGMDARFRAPRGIAFGPGGDLFVADGGNHTIRRVTAAGVVTTFAGTAGSAGTVDDTGTAARFNTPTDLSFDHAGNLLVLERGGPANGFTDASVRRITPGGVVTTLFDASGEAAALGTPAQTQFSRNLRGMVALGPKRIALTAGNAIVIRTLP